MGEILRSFNSLKPNPGIASSPPNVTPPMLQVLIHAILNPRELEASSPSRKVGKIL